MATQISVMITSRNRLADLQRTLAVIQRLDPPPRELMITADGCTDGTAEYVRREFPAARLFVNPVGLGSIAARHRMMRSAAGELVLSLDDDSYPEQTDCLERISRLFGERPNLAVAHFPQRSDEYPESLTCADFGPARFTRSFANSGACLRRSVYLALPGFEPRFFHAYEEPDYALQCVARGYEVYFAPIVTIRHHYSPQSRSRMRTHQLHARNQIWSTLIRCPLPYSLVLIAGRTINHFVFAARQGLSWVVQEPVWWWQALMGIPYCVRKFDPVPWEDYKRWFSASRKRA